MGKGACAIFNLFFQYNMFLAASPYLLHMSSWSPYTIIGAMVTDLTSYAAFTNINRAVKAIKAAGLKIPLPDFGGVDIFMLEMLGLDRFEAATFSYESRYMTTAEIRKRGPQATVNAGFVGAKSHRLANYILFQDNKFGEV